MNYQWALLVQIFLVFLCILCQVYRGVPEVQLSTQTIDLLKEMGITNYYSKTMTDQDDSSNDYRRYLPNSTFVHTSEPSCFYKPL